MKRQIVFGLAVMALLLGAISRADATTPGKLIEETDAQAAGLTRAWFAQTELDGSFEKVTSATVQDGVLLVTTDGGILQLFDAEKGTTLWTASTGEGYLLPPAINSKFVAALNGSTLIIYDRATGDRLGSTEVYGEPSSGPMLSERELYVPTFAEKILSYAITPVKQDSRLLSSTIAAMTANVKDLKNVAPVMEKKFADVKAEAERGLKIEPISEVRPRSTATFGIASTVPVLGTQNYDLDVIGWTSDEGWLVLAGMQRNVGDAPFKLMYKLQARPYFSYVNERRAGDRALIPRVDVTSTPWFFAEDRSMQNMATAAAKRRGGLFVVGSRSGHVFAMNDVTGALRWTYLTETPASSRIGGAGDLVLIPTESGDFFAVNVSDGREAWRAGHIKQFVSASQTRAYAVDDLDRLAVLNLESGARLKTLTIGLGQTAVFNAESDRIFLVSEDGLVQCLHETQQTEPLHYRESCAEAAQRISDQIHQRDLADGKTPAKATAPVQDDEDAEPAASAAADDDEEEEADEDDDPFASSDDDDDADSGSAPAEDSDSGDDDDPFGGDDDEEDPFA